MSKLLGILLHKYSGSFILLARISRPLSSGPAPARISTLQRGIRFSMPPKRASGMDSWGSKWSVPQISSELKRCRGIAWESFDILAAKNHPKAVGVQPNYRVPCHWKPVPIVCVWGLDRIASNPRERFSSMSVLSFKVSWWTRHKVRLISLLEVPFWAILSRKKLDEFGSELAGFIFTREHHHLTQIFGWPLQATWASVSVFDDHSDYADWKGA